LNSGQFFSLMCVGCEADLDSSVLG
jgi:hypothetical protein